MERTTWTRGGEKKRANPVNWSLLQMVRSNFSGSLFPSEEQQTEPGGGMVFLQVKGFCDTFVQARSP